MPPGIPSSKLTLDTYAKVMSVYIVLVMILMMVNCFLRNGWPMKDVNPLSANPTKLLNTLKAICWQKPANCLSVFDQFVGLPLKGLSLISNRDHCQMFSPKPTSSTPRISFELMQNLNSGFVE